MKKKKYVIVKTGEEVKIGDVVRLSQKRTTSFGTFKRMSAFKLSPTNIETFIKNGIIKCVEENEPDSDNLGYYVELASMKMKCPVDELVAFLDKLNTICPKAVLDFLLQTIAIKYYNDDPEGFDKAEQYYSLRPKDGEVGRVYSINSYIPLFKSEEEAKKAREILKDQLTLMYGKS